MNMGILNRYRNIWLRNFAPIQTKSKYTKSNDPKNIKEALAI
jgi:hypothetical protein